MRTVKAVPPPADSEYYWKRLMNHLYGCGEDELFRWLRRVKAYVEVQENERKRETAA